MECTGESGEGREESGRPDEQKSEKGNNRGIIGKRGRRTEMP